MHRRKFYIALVASIFVIAVVAGVPSSRDFFLRLPGEAIVVPVPAIKSCDIVVLSVDVDGAGALTASNLVRRGVTSRVAVFADPPSGVDFEFLRRGLPYYDAADRSIRQLHELGVQDVEVIPRGVVGSQDEGRLMPEWCDRNHFTSVVLVGNTDHGRRLQRIMRRAMAGHRTHVIVYPSKYSGFDSNAWWKTHNGIRSCIEEFEKLLLDVVRHPLS